MFKFTDVTASHVYEVKLVINPRIFGTDARLPALPWQLFCASLAGDSSSCQPLSKVDWTTRYRVKAHFSSIHCVRATLTYFRQHWIT